MIDKLRKKFIFITLLSMGIVLYSILFATNYSNYLRIKNNANSVMEILKENYGKFPTTISPSELDDLLTEETPFETRYFTVTIDHEGNVITVDVSKIASIDEKEAKTYALNLYEKQDEDGFVNALKYSTITDENGIMYIFIDYSRYLSVFYYFLVYSFSLSLFGMAAFAILLAFLSKIVIKPVEESYIKQKSFITNVSHDIKTPLTIISADTELIEMEYGESEWTKDVKNQIARLTSLTNKLVFLSKIQEEEFVLKKRVFNLSNSIKDILENFESIAISNNKILKFNIEDNLYLDGDEEMIRQLIYLLVDNAIKYSSISGNIIINAKKSGKQIEMTFKNDVENIKIGNHDKLFERFYRLDSSRNSSTGGNGIGLSVVKAIVDLHNGKISCDSETTTQIKFKIFL